MSCKKTFFAFYFNAIFVQKAIYHKVSAAVVVSSVPHSSPAFFVRFILSTKSNDKPNYLKEKYIHVYKKSSINSKWVQNIA